MTEQICTEREREGVFYDRRASALRTRHCIIIVKDGSLVPPEEGGFAPNHTPTPVCNTVLGTETQGIDEC